MPKSRSLTSYFKASSQVKGMVHFIHHSKILGWSIMGNLLGAFTTSIEFYEFLRIASSQEKSGVVHRRGERGSSQVPIKFFSSGLTEQQDEQSEETPEPVLTIPTLGHQPVILGGLYSHSEDEFLPGKILYISDCNKMNGS